MDLSKYGIGILVRELMKCFNNKNIDKLAQMACSNSCEAFFGVLTIFLEGKRLNLEHTDLWKSMVLLVIYRTGNIDETHKELSSLLNLNVVAAEIVQLAKKGKNERKIINEP